MMSAARAQGKVLDVQLKGGKYRSKILDENVPHCRYVDGDALLEAPSYGLSEGGGPGRVGDDRGIGSTGRGPPGQVEPRQRFYRGKRLT